MSGPEDTDLPGGWEAAAAEYVLGLLPEDELRAFEARLSQDRDLQQDVEAWSEYFAALTDPVEAVAPPPQLLRRIEDRLFGRKRPSVWQQMRCRKRPTPALMMMMMMITMMMFDQYFVKN